MQGRIELVGNPHEVIVTGRQGNQQVQIGDAPPRKAALERLDSNAYEIRMGSQCARVVMAIAGETAHVHAFGQTFALKVVDPVAQAGQASTGGSREARAPMPGVVVDIHVAEGEIIAQGQSMMTIESMKILTAIPAPIEGRVATIHFQAGQPFEKGAVLVSLCPEDH